MGFDFSFTQEQEEIRKLAHEFAVNEMRPVAAAYDEKEETPWAVMHKAHDLGLDAASGFPEQYGGGGIDLMSSLILTEQLAWGDAGIGVSINATGLCGAAILAMGTEEQKQKYISQFCDPKQLRIGAMGLTEPNSGSDSMALETTATKVDGGFLLNGTKQFCTNGGIADIMVAFVTTDKSAGAAGIAGFVIEKDTAGMRQGRKESKLGVRASHTAQVIFEDCFVPEEARLGFDKEGNATGPGAVGALLMLEATRPLVAAGAVGIARAAYEFARDYSLERHAFGKPIARHEAIAFKLADMATEIDAAWLLTLRAAWMAQNGIPFARGEGSMAKLMAGDVAMRVTVDAVQVLGGYGYVKEYPVERFMRDAKIYQIWEGTAEIQRLVISRLILGERKALATRPRVIKQDPLAVEAVAAAG
ncbi:MAG: acyl-CoA dehydrogenase family protein [Candidatus Dormibacteraeota bacterium]|nr:acyl-CoA dehydrogenase family protein [Candidatus Dormibacteraeota bacterium]